MQYSLFRQFQSLILVSIFAFSLFFPILSHAQEGPDPHWYSRLYSTLSDYWNNSIGIDSRQYFIDKDLQHAAYHTISLCRTGDPNPHCSDGWTCQNTTGSGGTTLYSCSFDSAFTDEDKVEYMISRIYRQDNLGTTAEATSRDAWKAKLPSKFRTVDGYESLDDAMFFSVADAYKSRSNYPDRNPLGYMRVFPDTGIYKLKMSPRYWSHLSGGYANLNAFYHTGGGTKSPGYSYESESLTFTLPKIGCLLGLDPYRKHTSALGYTLENSLSLFLMKDNSSFLDCLYVQFASQISSGEIFFQPYRSDVNNVAFDDYVLRSRSPVDRISVDNFIPSNKRGYYRDISTYHAWGYKDPMFHLDYFVSGGHDSLSSVHVDYIAATYKSFSQISTPSVIYSKSQVTFPFHATGFSNNVVVTSNSSHCSRAPFFRLGATNYGSTNIYRPSDLSQQCGKYEHLRGVNADAVIFNYNRSFSGEISTGIPANTPPFDTIGAFPTRFVFSSPPSPTDSFDQSRRVVIFSLIPSGTDYVTGDILDTLDKYHALQTGIGSLLGTNRYTTSSDNAVAFGHDLFAVEKPVTCPITDPPTPCPRGPIVYFYLRDTKQCSIPGSNWALGQVTKCVRCSDFYKDINNVTYANLQKDKIGYDNVSPLPDGSCFEEFDDSAEASSIVGLDVIGRIVDPVSDDGLPFFRWWTYLVLMYNKFFSVFGGDYFETYTAKFMCLGGHFSTQSEMDAYVQENTKSWQKEEDIAYLESFRNLTTDELCFFDASKLKAYMDGPNGAVYRGIFDVFDEIFRFIIVLFFLWIFFARIRFLN